VSDQVLSIVLGFVLTTLIGGAFASYLQQRSWQHQKASDISESVAALVDKRWYRMQRLLSAIVARNDGRPLGDLLEKRLADYDAVLMEWNDQLNSRLATVGAYFGDDVRHYLDTVVNEDFRDTGEALESLYRVVIAGERLDSGAVQATTAKVQRLNNLAYNLSFVVMVRLREGRIGRRAPDVRGERYVKAVLRKSKAARQ